MSTTTATNVATTNARFAFHCSYMDQVDYRVYGFRGLPHGAEIEQYRGSEDCLAYARSIYNGTAEEFARNVLARQGGVVLRENPYRMTPELYDAYCAFLIASHEEDCRAILKFWQQAGYNGTLEPMRPLPVPMYWDHEANTYLVEPWYTERQRNAA